MLRTIFGDSQAGPPLQGAGSRTAEAALSAEMQSSPAASERATIIALLCLIVAIFYYHTLLYQTLGIAGGEGLFPAHQYGLTFNSMLLNLLHGRFDVDPSTIQEEGFIHGGATYAYFGIFPALLRAVFLPMRRFSTTDFTALSCLAAVSLMALFKLLSLLTVWRAADIRRNAELVVLFGAVILLSGPQVEFLVPSIFQEVCLWADVFAAAFVYLVLRGYCSDRGFTGGTLALMALAAGLCLLTRVSTALGLYIAFGLLWIYLAWGVLGRFRSGAAGFREALPLLAAASVLVVFAAIAGAINYGRWGNPFVFMEPRHYLWALHHPGEHRIERFEKYGDFNGLRLGYGLIYYFFPVWVLHDGSGHLLWSAFQKRMIDAVELPPSSFFISAPLFVGLTAYLFVRLFRYRDVRQPAVVVAVLSGLMVPAILMLCFIYMAFRYRIEFYPFLEFCAFVGFAHLLMHSMSPRTRLFRVAAYTSICASQALYFLHVLSPLGPTVDLSGYSDLISFYHTLLP